jgi:hypothetical protein
MSKRSINPTYVLKRASRQIKLLELKYQFAVEDGGMHCVKAERILKKATRLQERIQNALANIMVQKNRDHAEAIEINNKLKEKDNVTNLGSDSRPDSESGIGIGSKLAKESADQS